MESALGFVGAGLLVPTRSRPSSLRSPLPSVSDGRRYLCRRPCGRRLVVVEMSANRRPSSRMGRGVGASVTALALSIGWGLCGSSVANAFTEEQKLIAEAWRVVDQGYIDRTFNKQDWFKIRMKTIKRQYATRDLDSLTSTTTGELAGIGIELFPASVEGGQMVLNVEEEAPSGKSGLRPKDIIVEIDGEETSELTPDEAAVRIRGPPGTKVILTVLPHDQKDKNETRRFEMSRERLRLKTVRSELKMSPNNRKVGYVRVKSFNANTADDFRQAIESLQGKGAQEYVLDLRDNAGGYFPAGVEVAKLFLDQGTTVAYVVNSKGIEEEYVSSVPALVKEPVVVLVNRATASASEVLAGALKDNDRAVLVGEKTFGKGIVQTVSPLSDGSGLAVTVAKYETPKHNEVNKVGIFPNLLKDCPDNNSYLQCLPDTF